MATTARTKTKSRTRGGLVTWLPIKATAREPINQAGYMNFRYPSTSSLAKRSRSIHSCQARFGDGVPPHLIDQAIGYVPIRREEAINFS